MPLYKQKQARMNSLNIENAEWKKFKHLFKQQDIPAKTILLNEGDIAKHVFYIKKGCLRIYFNHEGKDITFQFFFEGESVSSIESFRTNQPSLFTIESIEPCVIYSISKRNLQAITDTSPKIKEQIDQFTFERLVYYQKLFLSRIKNNPEKRYLELLENNPKIVLRVPQHYLASFLGITSVSLSRIRNRL
ncbi:MAG: Crp/Fnr family transcriptional regulator [Sediminibacterium sp.]|nr:Crp/Fnr family transcriptional regulator [Sediminibacterium sp.]